LRLPSVDVAKLSRARVMGFGQRLLTFVRVAHQVPTRKRIRVGAWRTRRCRNRRNCPSAKQRGCRRPVSGEPRKLFTGSWVRIPPGSPARSKTYRQLGPPQKPACPQCVHKSGNDAAFGLNSGPRTAPPASDIGGRRWWGSHAWTTHERVTACTISSSAAVGAFSAAPADLFPGAPNSVVSAPQAGQ
jgi:hypothetical protein